MEKVRRYVKTGRLQSEEVDYKLEIATRLAAARDAMARNKPNWVRTLDYAFSKDNNLVYNVNLAKFRQWMEADPNAARTALRELWDHRRSAPERLRAFGGRFPWHTDTVNRKPDRTYEGHGISGTWGRLTAFSTLLMAEGAKQHPPVARDYMLDAYSQYAARKIARFLAGDDEAADNRVTLVQFHPSYAYEDFVQGYRPALTGDGKPSFEVRPGPLLRAATKARAETKADHFLIIDEINRGNLAKVFGELYFLLEYRDYAMTLQYAREDDEDQQFSLPKNLYIIGTMNTADRSIALIDLALRRRFHFVEFHPDKPPIQGLLRRWLQRNATDTIWVAGVVDEANRRLDDRAAAIGPSYFMRQYLDEAKVHLIWDHNVLPYLEECLFGAPDRLRDFELDVPGRCLKRPADDRETDSDDATEQGSGEDDEGDANT